MTSEEISRIQEELVQKYPDANIVVIDDQAEVIAEIELGRAIAVIERSQPHFHRHLTETYRVLSGTLCVASGGIGHIVSPNQTLKIPPGQIHYARGVDGPAWVEVLSNPPWAPEDHFIL